jgi:hypothetical protein
MSEDRTTVLEDSSDADEYDDDYRGPGRWIAIAAVVAVALGVAGYFAGHASAGGGPSTLAEAVQQAQDGKLACGDTGAAATPPAGAAATPPAGADAAGGPPGAGGANGGAFFLRAICDRSGATAPDGGQGFPRGGFGGGRGGQVQSLNGDTLVLRDRQGQTIRVKLTSSTTVRKSTTGSLSDVKPGATVTVAGNPATSVTILPATQ